MTSAVNEEPEELSRIQDVYRETRQMLEEMFYVGNGRVIYARTYSGAGEPANSSFPRNGLFRGHSSAGVRAGRAEAGDYFNRLVIANPKTEVCDFAIGLVERLLEGSTNQSRRATSGRSFTNPSINAEP